MYGVCIIVSHTLSSKIKKKSSVIALFAIIIFCVINYLALPNDLSDYILAAGYIAIALTVGIATVNGFPKYHVTYLMLLILGFILAVSTSIYWMWIFISREFIGNNIIDVFSNLAVLTVFVIFAKKKKLHELLFSIISLPGTLKILFLASTWICGLLISLFTFFYVSYINFPAIELAGVLTFMLIILFGIMCPLLIIYSLSSIHYKNLSVIMDKQIKIQLTHYETISEINKDIRRFKHDYRNLLIGLTETLKRNDAESALALLNSDEMLLAEITSSFETGNVVLDAILNEKQLSAQKANTSITFEGVVPGNLINPIDICIIFGNAIDNAIEACASLSDEKKKNVSVETSLKNGFLFIRIDNPSAGDFQIINNNVATTKNKSEFHGIGLQSIKTAVSKYHGDIKLSYIDGVFSIEISLDLNMCKEL
jgi:hypothetical protein